jgi:hypothetical protein
MRCDIGPKTRKVWISIWVGSVVTIGGSIVLNYYAPTIMKFVAFGIVGLLAMGVLGGIARIIAEVITDGS